MNWFDSSARLSPSATSKSYTKLQKDCPHASHLRINSQNLLCLVSYTVILALSATSVMLAVLRDFGKNALRSIYTFQAWLGNLWVGWSSMRHSNTSNPARAQCRKSFAKISRSSVTKRIRTSSSSRRASSLRQLGQHWITARQVYQYACFRHKILWISVVCET